MRVLVYMKKAWPECLRLETLVRYAALDAKVEVCHTRTCLIQQIRRAMSADLIAVLVASSGKELKHLLSIKEFIEGIPFILILPDQEKGTIFRGHQLRPRFVSFLESDFTDVSAVLAKMLERAETVKLIEERQGTAGSKEYAGGSKKCGARRGGTRNQAEALRVREDEMGTA